MGSFSTSCLASGLPIGWRTPIRYLALMQKTKEPEWAVCYMDTLWVPFCLPLKGTYNDYGSIEAIEPGPVADHFFETLSLLAIERRAEEGFSDTAVVKGMPREQWLRALWSNRVIIRDPATVLAHLRPRASYQAYLDEQYPGQESPAVPEHPFERDILAKLPETGEDDGAMTHRTYPLSWAMIREDVWQLLIAPTDDKRKPFYTLPMNGDRRNPTCGYGPVGHPDIEEFFRARSALWRLSKIWLPGHITGPQVPEWELPARFAKGVAAIASRQAEEQAYEYGEG